MTSSADAISLGELREAHDKPWAVADRWRRGGGQVVGLFGHFAPRELVLAAGMLPLRLDPARVVRPGSQEDGGPKPPLTGVLAGLTGELPAEPLSVLSALLSGGLDWVDALLIGRDSEAYAKLFYLLRDMANDPELGPSIPRFAFSDVLRLPTRTSAVYNRRRLRELQQTVAGWAQRRADAGDLAAAIDMADAITGQLDQLERLRSTHQLSASEMLLARRGAHSLPPAEAAVALDAVLQAAGSRAPDAGKRRVFVTGSEPTLDALGALEAAGLALVGDDWGAEGVGPPGEGLDPLDRLADRYQYSAINATRAGLDRVAVSAERVRALSIDAIVQLLVPSDEASEWELAEFRRLLPGIPVITVRLDPGAEADALRRLVLDLTGALEVEPPSSARTGADV